MALHSFVLVNTVHWAHVTDIFRLDLKISFSVIQGECVLSDFSSPPSISKAADDEEDSHTAHEPHDNSKDDQPHFHRRLGWRGQSGQEALKL